MQNIKKKYLLPTILIVLAPLYIPLLEVIIKIIFTLGGTVGTYVRTILDTGICL